MKELSGKITHFFPNIMVAVVKLEKDIRVGDRILIEGPEDSFGQTVESMQVDKKPIELAKKGTEVGLKVLEPVKVNFLVYKIA
jgi:U32 family peptidase